jgi:hypothetical protein
MPRVTFHEINAKQMSNLDLEKRMYERGYFDFGLKCLKNFAEFRKN